MHVSSRFHPGHPEPGSDDVSSPEIHIERRTLEPLACLRISRFVIDMTWAEPLLHGGLDLRWVEALESLEDASE